MSHGRAMKTEVWVALHAAAQVLLLLVVVVVLLLLLLLLGPLLVVWLVPRALQADVVLW
jgi:hypothetical protein